MNCMKKVLVILFSTVVGLNASAQKVVLRPAPIYRPHSVYVRPYVCLGYGYNYGYNPWFYGGLGYGYPYYNHPYYNYPSRLDRKIMDIENDYSDRIESVRLDNSLSGHERRQKIRELRRERRDAVYDAKRNYYKQF